MTRLSYIILNSTPVQRIIAYARRVHPKGFEGLSLYTVAKFFIKEVKNNRLNVLGAAATYNFVMAMPPTLLFVFSLVPYLPLQGVKESIDTMLVFLTPNQESYMRISAGVHDFLENERRELLSFGILLTLFFSSNGMMGLMRSFDRSMPVYKKRSGIRRRWTAIKLTVMIITVAILSLAALIIQSNSINSLLERYTDNATLIRLLPLPVIVLLVFSAISLIYRYGPSLTEKFDFVSAGSVFATTLCVITTTVFFFLVDNVLQYDKVYGSIGTILAMMVWLYINTLIILLGFELNVSILLGKTAAKEHREKPSQLRY